jgi:uncharacterized membrane protein YgdD (TMEM256/DUF423 family)
MLPAAVFCGLGVAFGAFGAHALRATLEANGHLDEWQTAVHYQLVHGIALFALAVWCRVAPPHGQPSGGRAIGWLWSLGIVCFSGSLFALSLGAPTSLLWPITPLGGLCFLAGWIVLALDSLRASSTSLSR